MRIEVLEYLIAIEEAGSLSKAADRLYMTHSALSTALTQLENEVGEKIFIRSHQGATMTDFGRSYLALARQVLIIYQKMLDLKCNYQPVVQYNIASIATLSNNILLKAISQFQLRHHDVIISSYEVEPHEVLERIQNYNCDIGLSFIESDEIDRIVYLSNMNNIIWEPVYKDSMCLYVNKYSSLLSKEKVCHSDLSNLTAVSINHRQFDKKKFYYINNIDERFQLSFSNQEVIKKLIAESHDGNIVAYFPKLLAYDDFYIKSGMLLPVNIEDEKHEIIYYLAYKEKNKPHLKELLEYIKNVFREISKSQIE
ncbi:LysR family transcriptional regulator [Peptococcus simiae]|uniref:LysR family transcriptional regulator n=1 Tax=Peptococcus simiae TaxID=1643805 RepID=UPI00397EF9C4